MTKRGTYRDTREKVREKVGLIGRCIGKQKQEKLGEGRGKREGLFRNRMS